MDNQNVKATCPGGDYVLNGKWVRKARCGQEIEEYTPAWLAKAAAAAPQATAVVPPKYSTGLCRSCGQAEADGRAEMRNRRPAKDDDDKSGLRSGGKYGE